VTADYNGEVGFTNTDIVIYEAVFMELRQPAQIIASPPRPNEAENELIEMFISASQHNQNGGETPTDAVIQADSDYQNSQSNMPVLQEITREELLVMLGGAEIETQVSIAETRSAPKFIVWMIPIVLGGILLILRKALKLRFPACSGIKKV
jgi:hypothetical protein